MKPTIQMIADYCDVSRGTVDRVLNCRPNVNPEVRKKVQNAIEELGYCPPKAKRAASGAKTIRVGVLIPQWLNSYFREQTFRGIRQAQRTIGDFGFEIITEEMASRSAEEYVRRMEHMAKSGIRGLILNASDNEVVRLTIDRLVEQDIPVVTYDSDVPESRRLCFIGQDLMKCGQVAAGLMAKFMAPKDKILVVTGNLEFGSHRERVNGFCSRMHSLGFESESYEILECYELYDMTSDGVCGALKNDRRIRGIYMATESVAGCVDGIKRAQLPYKIHLTCNDMTPDAKKYLQTGQVDFVIGQTFDSQAYRALLVLYNLFRHGIKPKDKIVYTDISIISQDLL